MKRLTIILVCFLLLAIININSNVKAISVEVVFTFQEDFIEHKLENNQSLNGNVTGTLTCTIDAEDVEYQYIKVVLRVISSEDWAEAPKTQDFFFTESGSQDFSIHYYIPKVTPNQTTNVITVEGTWTVEHYGPVQKGDSGDIEPGDCSIRLIREVIPIIQPITYPDYNGDPSEQKDISVLLVIALISVLSAVILVIIVFLIYRRYKVRNRK